MCAWKPLPGKHRCSQSVHLICCSAPVVNSRNYTSVCRNALAIALFLEDHKAVSKVLYPGLASHPQHAIAKRQQHGFGAMITFYCVGGREQSRVILQNVSFRFIAHLKITQARFLTLRFSYASLPWRSLWALLSLLRNALL